ncbi:AN1-type zinc finger protein 1 isoform X1 [Carcharodon carcharias]|uniref:AN1-type zinc finger protein 1 isoform X1 n=1 Tax=Carcharodon carcharias TaxID=13397 RepID=UPI001B7E099E|nr:AN1-type zinc finger protein 1 isoform X1 [Carcharodon carcharias]
MAELEVGQQCVVQHCRQLDFLPFVCDGCSGIYCLEHRSKDAHHCSGVCSRKPVKSEGTSSYKCTYKSCKTKELLPIICLHCEKNFCLGHRHQSDHNCEKQEVPKSRLVVPQQVVKETVAENAVPLKKGRKGARNSATAAKVALMKMKLHAVGDKTIPQVNNERVFFQVFLPKGNKEKSRSMFFCSKWSIGKMVDNAASLLNLRNDNNILASKKLRLCHSESGSALPMDQTLELWIANTDYPLINGGIIILEYLDNDCVKLESTNSYME